MTKYILAGGNDRDGFEYGRNLATEIKKTLTGTISVLSCFFSQPEEDWQERADGFEIWFRENLEEDITWTLANEADFLNQVQAANVIYLHGGDNDLLMERLKNYPNLAECFKDKVVIGSSAGAICLAQKSWSCDSRGIVEGLGLVPTNTIVHFDSDYAVKRGLAPIDWKEAEIELRAAIGHDKQTNLLPEGEFEVFIVEAYPGFKASEERG